MYDDYICHHGIKGMKWGIRRTPEQLGHAVSKAKKKVKGAVEKISPKKKKPAAAASEKKTDANEVDVETRKKQVLESRSAKQLYDNASLFTTQELQAAYTRLTLERNIKNLEPKTVSKGQQYLDKYVKTANNLGAFLQSTNKVLSQANVMMKVLNSLSGGSDKKNSDDKNSSGSSDKKTSDDKKNSKSSSETKKNQSANKGSTSKRDRDDEPTYEVPNDNGSDRNRKDTRSTVTDVVLDIAKTRRSGGTVEFDRGMDYVADILSSLPEGTTVKGLLDDGNNRRRR